MLLILAIVLFAALICIAVLADKKSKDKNLVNIPKKESESILPPTPAVEKLIKQVKKPATTKVEKNKATMKSKNNNKL